ncbi:TonB-dependent receptor domain-containing protein [Thalassotalea atypica]|uniref:TonB-dependent receptor domain-containing protein n=1 Tax=Thalassotalea atypica TaxID=2054316 RepID=UPI00257300BE|nr:TonB-dependent receptor [Thalassotalea atypica]
MSLTSTSGSQFLKRGFTKTLLAICIASASSQVWSDEAKPDEEVERINITGSYIKSANFHSSSPILSIDAIEISKLGETNVGQFLASVPSITGQDTASSNNTNAPQVAGINTVALRNLGRSRTLVLVNGRRHVSGTSAGAGYGVDLNSIPTSIVKRIDVLTGNQSATYGSDAIAGVINIITKNDFEGVKVLAQVGQGMENGDNEKKDFELTLGKNFAEGGNIWGSYTYSKHDGLLASERDFSAEHINAFKNDGSELLNALGYGGSSHIPSARVGGYKGDGSKYVSGQVKATSDQFDFQEHRYLVTPIERNLFAAGATLELNDQSTLNLEATYSRVESTTKLEPLPLHTLKDIFKTGLGGVSGINLDPSLGAVHPLFDGTALQASLLSDGKTSLDSVGATFRRTVELGERVKENVRTTFRVAGSIDYSFDNGLYLIGSFTHGRTHQDEVSQGDMNLERARYALDIEADIDNGGYRCVDDIARLAGCVPFNPFNAGDETEVGVGWTEAASDYLGVETTLTGEVEQTVVNLVLTGEIELDSLESYPEFAVGIEYRDETGLETPDSLSQAGVVRGLQMKPTEGGFDVAEVFGELKVPVTEWLSMDAAIRYGDYSSIGGALTWKLGADISPTDSLRLRGALSTAVRAPNVSDLYAGGAANASLVFDPCDGVTATTSGTVADNCRSFTRIQERITDTDAFTLSQTEKQGTSGFTSGNEEMQEETAESLTVGVVYAPEFIEGLSLSLDYYDIGIEDAIGFDSKTTVVDRCYAQASFDQTCGGNAIRSVASGALLTVNSIANNLNNIDTSGLDVELDYRKEIGDGTLSLALVANFLDEYTITGIENGDVDERAGEVLYPELRFNTTIGYTYNNFNVSWRLRYWDDVVDDNNKETQKFTDELNEFDAVYYHDLSAKYALNENYTFAFGIRNLTDKSPYKMSVKHEYQQQGAMTNGTAWDTEGRRFFASVTAEF